MRNPSRACLLIVLAFAVRFDLSRGNEFLNAQQETAARDPQRSGLLLGLLMFSVLRRCVVAALDPGPAKVQAAVKQSILSLIWLDAAMALVVANPAYAIAIAALLIPALLLGRWVYST